MNDDQYNIYDSKHFTSIIESLLYYCIIIYN